MIEVVPALLTNKPNEVLNFINLFKKLVKRVQIDIVDNAFAANQTIAPELLSEIETDLKIDYHLMVDKPIEWINRCVVGRVDRIIGQIEKMKDQKAFVGEATRLGVKVGLAINIDTNVNKINPVIVNDLDCVLVMCVRAGFGGQKFNSKALTKIKKLDEIRSRDDTPYRICADGGVTLSNIRDIKLAGADEVSIGKMLNIGDPAQNIKKLCLKALNL